MAGSVSHDERMKVKSRLMMLQQDLQPRSYFPSPPQVNAKDNWQFLLFSSQKSISIFWVVACYLALLADLATGAFFSY